MRGPEINNLRGLGGSRAGLGEALTAPAESMGVQEGARFPPGTLPGVSQRAPGGIPGGSEGPGRVLRGVLQGPGRALGRSWGRPGGSWGGSWGGSEGSWEGLWRGSGVTCAFLGAQDSPGRRFGADLGPKWLRIWVPDPMKTVVFPLVFVGFREFARMYENTPDPLEHTCVSMLPGPNFDPRSAQK